MEAINISWYTLSIGFLLMLIPLGIFMYFKVRMIGDTLVSLGRMTLQLFLIGIFLEFLFDLNNPWVNIGWVLVMIFFASFSAIRSSELRYGPFLVPAFLSFLAGSLSVLLYFNQFIVDIENVLDARYLIAVGGMLLGNTLRANIIGISNFYQRMRRDENRYMYRLSLGASFMEGLLPFIQHSLREGLKPSVAAMATMGIVFLPGMMTGQILGGSDPVLAIKYQIAIMIVIFTATTISITLTILLSIRNCFNGYGMIDREIFRKG